MADALLTEPRTYANLQANYKHNDLIKCMIYNGIHHLYYDTVLDELTMLSRRHNGACIVDEILMQQRLYAGITSNSGQNCRVGFIKMLISLLTIGIEGKSQLHLIEKMYHHCTSTFL